MKIDNTSNTSFQAKFIVKDEARLLKSCSKRLHKIAKSFEEKTAKYPNDSFTLHLDKCNDASFIAQIGKYKDTTPLKENGLETLLSFTNNTIVNKLVKIYNTAQKCAKLNKNAEKFINSAKKTSPRNKTLYTDPIHDVIKDATGNIKLDTVRNDKYLNEYVIKALM